MGRLGRLPKSPRERERSDCDNAATESLRRLHRHRAPPGLWYPCFLPPSGWRPPQSQQTPANTSSSRLPWPPVPRLPSPPEPRWGLGARLCTAEKAREVGSAGGNAIIFVPVLCMRLGTGTQAGGEGERRERHWRPKILLQRAVTDHRESPGPRGGACDRLRSVSESRAPQ